MGFAVNLLRDGDDCEKAEAGRSSPFPASGVHRTVINNSWAQQHTRAHRGIQLQGQEER